MAEGASRFEGVIVVLARLNPADQPGVHETLTTELRNKFGVGSVAAFECLGRYDGVYIIRVPDLAFDQNSRIPIVSGIKKIDVQYGYVQEEGVEPFWTAVTRNDLPALALSSYVRVRDDLTQEFGKKLHQEAVLRLLDRWVKDTKVNFDCSLVIRGLGWPDYIVVACSDHIDRLVDFAAEKLWGSNLEEVAVELEKQELEKQDSEPTVRQRLSNLKKPLFSRTYTLLSYPDRSRLHSAEGMMTCPQICLRLRPGGQYALEPIVQRAVSDWNDDKKDKDDPIDCSFRLQFGTDDAGVEVFPKGKRGETTSLDAGKMLDWYRNYLLRDRHPGDEDRKVRLADIVTTSELRVGFQITKLQHFVKSEPLLETDVPAAVVMDPKELVKRIEEKDCILVRPVASSMQNLSRTINWAMANEGIYRDFADLARHCIAFHRYVEQRTKPDQRGSGTHQDGRLSADLLHEIGQHTSVASRAFAQRLAGSYYDLGSDSPETVLEYSGGIQKILTALFAVQQMFLSTAYDYFSGISGKTERRLDAYWVITPEGDLPRAMRWGNALALFVCSSLAFHPARACYEVTHELSHILWDMWMHSLKSLPADEDSVDNHDGITGLNPTTLVTVEEGLTQKLWQKVVRDELYRSIDRLDPVPFKGERIPIQMKGDDFLRQVHALLDETFPEVMAFIIALNGNIERYRDSISDVLARANGVHTLVFTSWVLENLHAELGAMGWTEDSRLSDFLRDHPVRGVFIDRLIDNASRIPRTPSGASDQQWKAGWRQLTDLIFDDQKAQLTVCRCVAYLVAQAGFLAGQLDTTTSRLHRAISFLTGVGAIPDKSVISPDPLEDLWHEAVTLLGP